MEEVYFCFFLFRACGDVVPELTIGYSEFQAGHPGPENGQDPNGKIWVRGFNGGRGMHGSRILESWE